MRHHQPPPPEIFVSEMPEVAYRAHNVHVAYRSGELRFARVWLRSQWRRFLERELRNLNEQEAAEQGRVVPAERMAEGRRARGKGKSPPQRTCPD